MAHWRPLPPRAHLLLVGLLLLPAVARAWSLELKAAADMTFAGGAELRATGPLANSGGDKTPVSPPHYNPHHITYFPWTSSDGRSLVFSFR